MIYTYKRKGNKSLNIGSFMIGPDGIDTEARSVILDDEVGKSLDRYINGQLDTADKSILAYVSLLKDGTVKIIDMEGKPITLGKTFIPVAGTISTKVF